MSIRNWAGNVTFTPERLYAPSSVDELSELVAASPRVRALGTGHSFNRIADTTGALVSVRNLPSRITISPKGIVSVGAGTRYGELAVALHEAGRALHNLGSLPHISIAGACATGTHGSGSRNRCLASAVVGVEFVRADGELIVLDTADPAFRGSVLALGALGIVTRLRLTTEPTYEVTQDVWVDAPLPALLSRIDDVLDCAHSVSIFTRWQIPDVVDQIWIKARHDGQRFDASALGARPATEAMHPIVGQDGSTATQQFGEPGPWHERLPHFRLAFTPSNGDEQQSEYLLSREHAVAAIEAISRLDYRGALQVCEIRAVAPDDLWLSPFAGRPTVALHFTWVDDDERVAAVVDDLEAAIAPFDPRPHWGKVFRAAPTWHRPALPAFHALLERHDPDRKFGNDFLAQHIY